MNSQQQSCNKIILYLKKAHLKYKTNQTIVGTKEATPEKAQERTAKTGLRTHTTGSARTRAPSKTSKT